MISGHLKAALSLGFGGFCGILGTSYFFSSPHHTDLVRAAGIGVTTFLIGWLVFSLKRK